MKNNNKFSDLLNNSVEPLIAASFTDNSEPSFVSKSFEQGLSIAEIRADLFSNTDENYLVSKIKAFKAFPNILTIRSSEEGGNWNKGEAERLELYKLLIPYVDAVDIELNSAEIIDDIVNLANENNCNLILSYHNFEITPELSFLENVIDKSVNKGADIIKIACFVKNDEDYLRLQNLLYDHEENLVVIGMGDKGMKSRLDFPKLGSKFTFCSLEMSTAPGQISLEEMLRGFNET